MTADTPPATEANTTTHRMKATIPADWKEVRLGDVADVNPKRPRLSIEGTTQIDFLPMAAIAERCAGILYREYRNYTDVQRGYTYFEENDTLFSKITPCLQNGKHTLAKDLDHGFGFGTTEFHVVRPGPHIQPGYLFRILTQRSNIVRCARQFRGTAGQQRMHPDALRALRVFLPLLPEQQAITAILDSIDEAIGRTEELITATEHLRDALRHQLLTRGLPGWHTSWHYLPGLKATIPTEWKVVHLSDIADVRKEKMIPATDTSDRYIGLEHMSAEQLNSYGKAQDTFSHKTVFYSGDTLYGKLRPNLRKCVRVDFNGVCSTDILALYAKPSISKAFVDHLIKSDQLYTYAMRGITGSRMPRTSWKHLRKFQLACPPLPEQKAIAAILDSVDTAVERHRVECDALKGLKVSAADALLTGRVRVPAREGGDG